MKNENVIPIEQGRRISGGDGNGLGNGEFDNRLRKLEQDHIGLKKDISWIKKTMATKQDISNLKVWILAGVIGGIAIAAGIAATVVKAFF